MEEIGKALRAIMCREGLREAKQARVKLNYMNRLQQAEEPPPRNSQVINYTHHLFYK